MSTARFRPDTSALVAPLTGPAGRGRASLAAACVSAALVGCGGGGSGPSQQAAVEPDPAASAPVVAVPGNPSPAPAPAPSPPAPPAPTPPAPPSPPPGGTPPGPGSVDACPRPQWVGTINTVQEREDGSSRTRVDVRAEVTFAFASGDAFSGETYTLCSGTYSVESLTTSIGRTPPCRTRTSASGAMIVRDATSLSFDGASAGTVVVYPSGIPFVVLTGIYQPGPGVTRTTLVGESNCNDTNTDLPVSLTSLVSWWAATGLPRGNVNGQPVLNGFDLGAGGTLMQDAEVNGSLQTLRVTSDWLLRKRP